jgi:hypothetical protein
LPGPVGHRAVDHRQAPVHKRRGTPRTISEVGSSPVRIPQGDTHGTHVSERNTQNRSSPAPTSACRSDVGRPHGRRGTGPMRTHVAALSYAGAASEELNQVKRMLRRCRASPHALASHANGPKGTSQIHVAQLGERLCQYCLGIGEIPITPGHSQGYSLDQEVHHTIRRRAKGRCGTRDTGVTSRVC